MSQPTHIIVIYASPVVRDGILALLATEADLVTIEAATYEEVIDRCQEHRPNLLAVSLNILVPSISELMVSLWQASPHTNVLALAVSSDDVRLQTLINAGVRGFALLYEPRKRLVEAIRTVAAGKTWFSQRVMEKLVQEARQELKTGLTPQQLVVLGLVAQGKTNRQIAQELGIKARTVRFHLEGIFTRLDVQNRAEAVAKAVREGLLDLEA